MSSIQLNYEAMVSAYWESLNQVLRGFNAQGEFLDLWVPDEDPVSSILNLAEAVQETGHDQMELTLGAETLGKTDLSSLEEQLVRLGEVKFKPQGEGKLLTLSGLTEGAAFHNLHPAYVQAVREAYKGPSFEGTLEPQAGLELVRAEAEGVSLTALVEPQRQVIQELRWTGAQGPLQRGLLNGTAQTLRGLSLLEASDHGVLRLEDRLRSERQRRPSLGMVIPEQVEPAFLLPKQLMHQLLAAYRQQTGFSGKVNFFVSAPTASWTQLNLEQRQAKVSEFILRFWREKGLGEELPELIKLEESGRLTLDFPESMNVHTKAEMLLKLERFLDKNLEEHLHLYMLELEDKNSKRRLILQKEGT